MLAATQRVAIAALPRITGEVRRIEGDNVLVVWDDETLGATIVPEQELTPIPRRING